jgi:hypothetical protein
MKVERTMPSHQDPDPAAPRAINEASTPNTLPDPTDSQTVPESSQPPQTEARLRPNEDLDLDLAFEKDELIFTPDNRTPSSGPKIWQVKGSPLKLSALEATVSVKRGLFTYDHFEM